MSQITKTLDVAVEEANAGRITTDQLMAIFQEAINNGDILEEANEFCTTSRIIPLVNNESLKSSTYLETFMSQMESRADARLEELKREII